MNYPDLSLYGIGSTYDAYEMCLHRKQNSVLSTLLEDDDNDKIKNEEEMNFENETITTRTRTTTKSKYFNPDRHCGVMESDQMKPCTRSLSCKKHSINLRRQVQGRSQSFNELFKKYRTKEISHEPPQIPPQIQETKVNKESTWVASSSSSSSLSTSLPQPYALCSFGARKIGTSFVFDRKQDHVRLIFSEAIRDINAKINDDLSQPKVKQKSHCDSPTHILLQPTTSSVFTPSPSSSSSTSSFTSTLNKNRQQTQMNSNKKRALSSSSSSTSTLQNSKFLKQSSASTSTNKKQSVIALAKVITKNDF